MSLGPYGRRRSRASLVPALAAVIIAATVASASHAAPAQQPPTTPAAGYLVWSTVAARVRPDARSRIVRIVPQFDRDYRPRVVLALAVRLDSRGRPAWYRISLPGRPNGASGWVRASALELKPTRRMIEVDRSARALTLRDGDRVVLRARVAVGAAGMETPLGIFYVTRKFRPTAPILGAFALETSGYSKLSEWPGGGVVGIHGTNEPWLLGQAVSHGCIRVANATVVALGRLTPVGTPVLVVA